MQIAFLCLVILSGSYFLYRKVLDPLLIAYGSSLIYFTPGLIGWIQFSKGFDINGAYLGDYSSTVLPYTYLSMMIVILSLVAAAFVCDRLPAVAAIHFPGDRYVPYVLTLFMVGCSIASIHTVSQYYLCADKTLTLAKIDVWYYWAAYSLPLCLISACLLRQWAVAAFCVVMLGADIFVGFRANTAICFLAICVLIGSMLFRSRRSAVAFVVIVLIGGFGLFLVKDLAYNIKNLYAVDCSLTETGVVTLGKRTDSAAAVHSLARAFVSGGTYSNSLLNSEPFVVQSILNETVKTQFSTGSAYLMRQILSITPGGSTVFQLDLGRVPLFADFYREALFKDVPFGMASNIWAQAYAAGGLAMLSAFATGYAGAVGGLSYLYNVSKGGIRATVLVIAMWIAFYSHRNDLMTELAILKQTLYIAVPALLISGIMFMTKLGLKDLRNIRLDRRNVKVITNGAKRSKVTPDALEE